MFLEASVEGIKGIGPKKAALLEKLGIKTIRDLLYYVPKDYENQGNKAKIKDLIENEVFNISGEITKDPVLRRIKGSLSIVTFVIGDETGTVEAVFFNQPYIKSMYRAGQKVYASGNIKRVGRKLQFTNPSMCKEGAQHEGMLPLYSLTAGLSQKIMRIIVKNVLSLFGGSIDDIFPNEFREENRLAEVNFALNNIHFPENQVALEQAKQRLLFEELLLFNIAMFSHEEGIEGDACSVKSDTKLKNEFLSGFMFRPTNAQFKVMGEIENDLSRSKPMNRLLQGDVGSGKTLPAFYAMYLCVNSGLQCAMMAPTEVLARQHFENALKVFKDRDLRIELVTGSTTQAQKRKIYENIAGGLTDIVFGTHALIYDKLQFAKLGLIVTDEQHRFGVNQRAMLEIKGGTPHVLIMSATPIPRTLALILYGKTDISIIDEMPPGRSPVSTFCVPENKREGMYGFIEKEIKGGAQVFVICPLIEQNEDIDILSSEEVYETLNKKFSRVALLHGKMKSNEKNQILQDFKDKKYDILVSTTVIEVGIDIPDATIMVIENAERFGLAQLHQLRGRVGRGIKKSYCFLMHNGENERLNILTKTNDGFKIAEEDLRLRGPGQFLGSRQSGVSDLYMSSLIRDTRLLEKTRNIAQRIFAEDKSLYSILETASKSRFQIKTS